MAVVEVAAAAASTDWISKLAWLAGGGATVLGGIAIAARKVFVNWSKEAVVVQGADATAAMMLNFHKEIDRLGTVNDHISRENRTLHKQISRLEAVLERICVKFDIDLADFDAERGNNASNGTTRAQ